MKSRKVMLGTLGIAVSMILWASMTLPASADWAFSGLFTGLDVKGNGPPDSFGDPQVCFNRIKGRVGDDTTLPPGPWTTRTVQIFASSEPFAGSTPDPNSDDLVLADGVTHVHPATGQTTAKLTELHPHETYQDFQGDTHTVYAAASFNIVPPTGSVHIGDDVAVKIQHSSTYVTRHAADCAPTSK